MNRIGALIGSVFLAAGALPVMIAQAADTPEMAEQKRQVGQAIEAFNTRGVCDVFADLRDWQTANWPEGQSVVTAFLNDKLLPHIVTDPAQVRDKTAEEIELEFMKFCKERIDLSNQVLENLTRAPAEETIRTRELIIAMQASEFLGQCNCKSVLYHQAADEHKRRLEQFLIARVYSRNAKYRHEEIDNKAMTGAGFSAEVDKIQANQDKVIQYAKDCDTAAAEVTNILKALQPAP